MQKSGQIWSSNYQEVGRIDRVMRLRGGKGSNDDDNHGDHATWSSTCSRGATAWCQVGLYGNATHDGDAAE